jgi:hypothetical protein
VERWLFGSRVRGLGLVPPAFVVGVGRLWLVWAGSGHAVGVLRKRAPLFPPVSCVLFLGWGWGWFSWWWPAVGVRAWVRVLVVWFVF